MHARIVTHDHENKQPSVPLTVCLGAVFDAFFSVNMNHVVGKCSAQTGK